MTPAIGANSPAVTIGMMARNSSRHIADAIASVVSQTLDDWELVICDDASEDGTEAAVRAFLGDRRVRYVRNRTVLGQSRNWWQTMSLANAPVFARLDADDVWRPDALERFLTAMRPEVDIVYAAWVRSIEATGHHVRGPHQPLGIMDAHDAYAHHAVNNTALPSAFAHKTGLSGTAGAPDPALRFMVDFEYNLRMLACARCAGFVDEPITTYRVHSENVSAEAESTLRAVAERPRVLELARRHARLGAHVANLYEVLEMALARNDFSDGLSEAVRRDRVRGYSIMRDAALRCPEIARHPKVRADLWLSGLGLPGYLMLRLLHSRRVRA